jgi:phospholipase/carboxylesterase
MREAVFGGLKVRITGGTDRNGGGDGPVVVLMHGFGVAGNDLLLLPRGIGAPVGTRYVFPEGLLRLGGDYGEGRAWWLIDMDEIQRMAERGQHRDQSSDEPPGLAEAHAHALAMLDEIERDLRPSKLVIGGFSQGSMLACDLVLRHPDRKIDALVILSGTPLAEDVWDPNMPKRRGLPVFLSHGDGDTLLPFPLAEKLRDKLKAAGLDVTWAPFHGGHGVPPETLAALGDFINGVLR